MVRPVADGVRPNLNAFAERFFEHRQQIVVGPFQQSARVVIGVRFQKCGPFRTQRAVETYLDSPAGEPIVKSANRRAMFEQPLGVVARAKQGQIDAQLNSAFLVKFFQRR